MSATVRVAHDALIAFTATIFERRGLVAARARLAAEALCYGDVAGMRSHGLVNLTRLYLPLLDGGRADPRATPRVLGDSGAAVHVDQQRALGLWAASAAVDDAVERARRHGIALVSARNATHIGCAGHHAARAAAHGMIAIVASNCGAQRIARPPGGRLTMLGTNPLSIAGPAGERHPFVLDMSTTAVPTGRVRLAARAGEPIPAGWLAADDGVPVTDPAAFDRGDAHLLWLGGPGAGAYKGYGLALAVELLAAALSGAALGPAAAALHGDGRPGGRDDDIGLLVIVIAPATLRPDGGAGGAAAALFEALLACPPVDAAQPVCYPGWHEGERARGARRDGVVLAASLYGELEHVGADHAVAVPPAIGTA